MGVEQGSDVAFAFALVIAAGLCTTFGAAFAFCARIASKSMLAISLGLSAGVMIYVSFGEIFMTKAVDEFKNHYCSEEDEEAGKDCSKADDKALQYATLCFFGGIIITYMLDLFVHQIMHHASCFSGNKPKSICDSARESQDGDTMKEKDEELGNVAKEEGTDNIPKDDIDTTEVKEAVEEILEADHHAHHLQKVGLMSGIAIALHNFPEGLATFVATLADPTAGVAIAVAIALHNIPEGVVVAMPVYYSTGSRMKGFLWAFLSGVSEPIGGLFGWVLLSNMGEIAYAVLFAVVAGMMVYIAVSELIPTALRFDPDDKYVTKSCFIGMAVMAASLLMFTV
ncbi:hypothetical protein BSKO_04050 [Bryopsis sp. KO-2023]|nr:hypothetical protein BSKO_04050 [Bryopsis sp. KO-2023]